MTRVLCDTDQARRKKKRIIGDYRGFNHELSENYGKHRGWLYLALVLFGFFDFGWRAVLVIAVGIFLLTDLSIPRGENGKPANILFGYSILFLIGLVISFILYSVGRLGALFIQ